MAAVIGALSILSGCGISTLTSSFSGGIFGGSSNPQAETQQKVSEGNLLTAAQNDAGKQVDITPPGGDCPTVSVTPGDNNITFMAKGGSDSLAVLHRGEITKTARECSPSISGGGVSVKFGFAGRVLLGPQGKAGTITLPVKVTLLDGGRTTIKTELVKVPVTVNADESTGYFSITRDLVVPVAQGASARNYRIIVAFDRRAPGAS